MTFTFPIANAHPSGFFQAMDAADARAAEHQRLRDFRTQVTHLLGIPPNATDTFILNENAELRCRNQELEAERDELLDRIEELEWEHKDDEPRVVQRG